MEFKRPYQKKKKKIKKKNWKDEKSDNFIIIKTNTMTFYHP